MNSIKTKTDVLRTMLLDPQEWEGKARQLFRAASVFDGLVHNYWILSSQERSSHQAYLSAYLMLSGFALENVLKAIIVAKQHDTLYQKFEQKQRLPKILQTHDLVSLFEEAGLNTKGKNIIGLLKRLTRCSTWESRYPIPLRPEQYRGEDTFSLGPGFITLRAFSNADVQNVRALFEGMLDVLKKMTKNVPTTETSHS